MHFARGCKSRGLEPLAGRPFDVKDYDVPLVLDYPTRPFQSSVVRIVFFEPVIGGPVAFVAGPEFPFHLRASPGNRFADTVVPVVNQIRTYWWWSPPRIGRQRMCPASSTAREIGASFSKDKCVRISL